MLVGLLNQVTAVGKMQNLTAAEIAVRAGFAPETLSRMKARKSADFGAVERMAPVVDLELKLTPAASKAAKVASGSFFD